eukprot:TRINITY_DN11029_c0_g1_i1.p1 TRINITY_DN11029_c0_g1~~TRINITY_DN11029_c0_g1_i1.p1  ORF type:complete len:188 (+),score=21.62 TRINITY_DN11029_c0_g1_i1:44-565(+)
MVDPRTFEIICGLVASIYVLYGIHEFIDMDLDDNVRKNMFKCSNGLFLIFFNLAAAFASLAPDLRLTAYFGYLVTVSGKALHFLLMGFYIYPLTCKSRSKCDPFRAFDKADGVFDKLLVVGSFTSIILGIMLLVLRCTGLSSHRSIGLQGGGGDYFLNGHMVMTVSIYFTLVE